MRLFDPLETPYARRAFQRIYLLAAGLQCATALVSALQGRSESSGVLGISVFRLALAAVLLAALLACAGMLAETWLRPERSRRRWANLLEPCTHPPRWWRVFLACTAIFLTGVLFLALAPGFQEPVAIAYAERLAPLVGLAAGLAAQTGAALLVFRRSAGAFGLRPTPRLFLAAVLGVIIVLAAWDWAMDSIGAAESVRVGWNRLGAPLVELQVFLAWIVSLVWMAFSAWRRRAGGRLQTRRRWFVSPDLWLSVLIWAAAVIAWQSTPVEPNWFLMQPLPPNFENYPSSDARAYDSAAQSALIGNGYIVYGLPYIRRPLLAFHMTVLHLLGEQDYSRVIFFQILALALIPVILYHLTRQIHSRAAAVLAAALVIFREANSIRVTGNITTSNVKLLMADMPAMLATGVFTLLLTLWLNRIQEATEEGQGQSSLTASRSTAVLALLCGGSLGLAMLVRLETFVFGAAIALAAAAILWPRRQAARWASSMLVILLGMGLVVSPWVARNYLRTGMVFIDSPYFLESLLFQRFNPSRDQAPDPAPQSTGPRSQTTFISPKIYPAQPRWQEPTPTPAPSTPGGNDDAVSLPYLATNAGRFSQAFAAHFLNNQVQLLLIMPTNCRAFESTLNFTAHRSPQRLLEECCQVDNYIRSLPYWGDWDGSFTFGTLLLLLINLAVIAWGLQMAWRRRGWAGIAAFILVQIYLLANSLFRNSGGRYILPVDWAVLLYFSVGLAQITRDITVKLSGRTALIQAPPVEMAGQAPHSADAPSSKPSAGRRAAPLILAALALVVIGSLPAILEESFPQRYSPERTARMEGELFQSERLSDEHKAALKQFLQHGAMITAGRALYPRFFAANIEDPNGQGELYEATPYARITFFLAGEVNDNLTMPIERKPKSFPNASDALVIRCADLDILAIALYAPDGGLQNVLLRSPLPEEHACPLPKEMGTQ